MKAISIIEPWATLICKQKKFIETRSWNTNYRGELYIHASLKKLSKKNTKISYLYTYISDVPIFYGHIIGKCRLKDCKYMDEAFITEIKKDKQEYELGEYEVGRYAWILSDIEYFSEPIPMKGNLGIWNFD